MISCCGLECTGCEAYIATQDDDDALREKVAKEWSAMYKADIKPEQIHCTGCQSDGALFFYCEHKCEIRKCAKGRGYETCAPCPDFGCDHLKMVHEMAPAARETLERLRDA
jgi:hypothetical protein